MRTPRIYTPQDLNCGISIKLEEPASNHLSKALRCQNDQPIILFNGQGGEYTASITNIGKKTVTAKVLIFSEKNIESPCQTHIAVALAKGDKMELIVQKATELGVSSITPIFTQRSDVKLNRERLEKKVRQWKNIIIAACEQSGRNFVPDIQTPCSFNDYISRNKEELLCLFHPSESVLLSSLNKPTTMHLCFGSEGGFSKEEIELAKENKATVIALGERVLRAETAPIAVLGAINALWGDW